MKAHSWIAAVAAGILALPSALPVWPRVAPVLWINSADDFINPPELGIAEAMGGRMPRARFVLIPISDATRGHGAHTQAAVWKDYLADFLAQTEPPPTTSP